MVSGNHWWQLSTHFPPFLAPLLLSTSTRNPYKSRGLGDNRRWKGSWKPSGNQVATMLEIPLHGCRGASFHVGDVCNVMEHSVAVASTATLAPSDGNLACKHEAASVRQPHVCSV